MRVDATTISVARAAESPRLDAPAPQVSTAQPGARAEAVQAKVSRQVEEQVRKAEEPRESAAPAPASRSRIRVDEASNRFIAQVVNENNEVIKQYPPEAILQFTARFRKLQGLLFDEQV